MRGCKFVLGLCRSAGRVLYCGCVGCGVNVLVLHNDCAMDFSLLYVIIATVWYGVVGHFPRVIVSIQFMRCLCNNFDSFGFDAFDRAYAFDYMYNIAICKPMLLLDLCPAIHVEEHPNVGVAF